MGAHESLVAFKEKKKDIFMYQSFWQSSVKQEDNSVTAEQCAIYPYAYG